MSALALGFLVVEQPGALAHDLRMTEEQARAVQDLADDLLTRMAAGRVDERAVRPADDMLRPFHLDALHHVQGEVEKILGAPARSRVVRQLLSAVEVYRRFASTTAAGQSVAWLLASEDERERAAAILVLAGEPDLRQLKASVQWLAQDPRPDVRVGAARLAVVLRWMDTNGAAATPAWMRAVSRSLLRDLDARVAANGAFILVNLDEPHVVSEVVRLSNDPRENVRSPRGFLRGGSATVGRSAQDAMVGRFWIRGVPGRSRPPTELPTAVTEWWTTAAAGWSFDPPKEEWELVLDEVLALSPGERRALGRGTNLDLVLRRFAVGEGIDGPTETTELVLREAGVLDEAGAEVLVAGNPGNPLGNPCEVTTSGWHGLSLSTPTQRDGAARIRLKLWRRLRGELATPAIDR